MTRSSSAATEVAGLESTVTHAIPQEGEQRNMRKSEQVSEFETYLNERQRLTTASLSAIEKAGTEAALARCRALAHRIHGELHNKRPEHFVNLWSLADFQVALERAASVLEQKSRRSTAEKR